MIIVIPFGEFAPDAVGLNAPALVNADNAWPSAVGYKPAKGLNGTRSAAITLDDCSGACLIRVSTLASRAYVHQLSGATHSIRSFDSTSFGAAYTGTEVGTGYAAPDTHEYWRFAKFGNFLIAVQDNVDPQVLNWSSAGSFGTLGGSPPRACGVFTIGDFVFLTGLASNRRKLQWSAINDHTGWTVGTNLSDEQEFPDGGDICGIAGGKSGYVIQRNAIQAFQFLPGNTSTIFEFSKLEGIPGCIGTYSWTTTGQTVYYLSEEGFCSIGPEGFKRIGAHRIDGAFQSSIASTTMVADPYRPLIWINYLNANMVVYDYLLDRFANVTGLSGKFPVDHIEATGGAAQLMIQDTATTGMYTVDGANLAAIFTTGDLQLLTAGPNAGQRALIRGVRPLVNGAVTSVAVSHKESLDDSYVTATSTTQETNGWFRFGTSQTSGLYHRFTVTTTASNTATYHQGVEVDLIPDGEA